MKFGGIKRLRIVRWLTINYPRENHEMIGDVATTSGVKRVVVGGQRHKFFVATRPEPLLTFPDSYGYFPSGCVGNFASRLGDYLIGDEVRVVVSPITYPDNHLSMKKYWEKQINVG